MTQKQFIESKCAEFNDRFSPDWWMGFSTQEDINELGVGAIRAFLSTSLKEIVEIHFKEIVVDKLSRKDWDMECDPDSYFFIGIHQHEGNNHCLDQITSRHNKYLS